MENNRIRVLSGIRASHSSLHLGNLLGAIDAMVKLQNNPNYETFFMVADLHGITTKFDPEELRKNRMEVAIDYLSAGIDPQKSVLFLQSEVSEHAEFAYYVSSVARVRQLEDLPALKEKLEAGNTETLALLSYPVLMAADILLYKAKKVPIGKDQLSHIEIARVFAKSLNSRYGLNFPLPDSFSAYGESVVIPSILGGEDNKNKKMSKSVPEGAIFLIDSFDEIKRKINKIDTNTTGKGEEVPTVGGIYTLLLLVESFISFEKRKELEKQYLTSGIRYGEVKDELAKAIYARLQPIQEKRAELEKHPEVVRKILDEGAEKARREARKTLNEVKRAMGLA